MVPAVAAAAAAGKTDGTNAATEQAGGEDEDHDEVTIQWFVRSLRRVADRLARVTDQSRFRVLMSAFDKYDRAGDGTFAPPDLDQALRGLELRLSRSTLEAIAWRFRWQSRNHRAIRVDYEQMVEFVLASAPYEDEDEGGRRSGRDSHRSGESKSDDEYDDDRRGSGSGRGGSGRER
eukprot:CAMPEP_0119521052 /NCGR_PEP_ID=MMETSP1344-20130328/36884_1 /TAXON_ID=236787 /ORGANISM="Florenciella parvula, Strain CCMP2471" /LENGTH=176 /DNA_ID=CAMNT_0007558991 /DNA_START=1 /DNA_END=528 /DNA_ORIENTATION=+